MSGGQSQALLRRSVDRIWNQEGFNRMLAGNFYTVSVLVFSAFLLLSLLRINSYTLDETVFHYPNLQNFYSNGWNAMFNEYYSAANTPLPYFITAIGAKLFSPSLITARVITACVSFSTFLLFSRVAEYLSVPKYSSFVFLFFPYFFVSSFVFYAVNYGLFFLVLALWQWIRTEKKHSYGGEFLTGICFSMGVLCQQFFLVLPLALAGSRALGWLLGNRQEQRKRFAVFFLCNLLLLLPLLLPLALFYQWGGLTHPNFAVHTLSFSPSTVVAILFVVGFYFSPYVFLQRKKITAVEAIASILTAILLVAYFRPVFSDIQGAGLFTGLVFRLITIPAAISSMLPLLLMTGCTALGLLVCSRLVRDKRSGMEQALLLMAAFLVITFSVNTQVGERHLLGLMMLLLLLLLPRMKDAATFYTLSMAAIGIGYFVYWYFFKFS